MNKTILTLLGVAAVGYAAYYFWNQSKKSADGFKCMSCGK